MLQTPDGTLVQDTVDIIDHLDADAAAERSAYPATPVHRAVAHLLELFGGEGLLRPAMHYRWDFDDTNVAFLSKDFSAALAVGADDETRDAVFAFASDRMRSRHRRLRRDRGAGARDRALLRGVPRPVRRPPGRVAVPARRPADHRRLRVHRARSTPTSPATRTRRCS